MIVRESIRATVTNFGSPLQRRDLVHLGLSVNEWRIVQDIIGLLNPFKVATCYLSAEKYPIISSLLEECKSRQC